MADLSELIEKVKAETGWEPRIDADVATTIGGYAYEKRGSDRKEWFYPPEGKRFRPRKDRPPAYTASLDAVVALAEEVLPGWWWRVSQSGAAELHSPALNGKDYQELAATPALALLLAILTAKLENTNG